MEVVMNSPLQAIRARRAIKHFVPVVISDDIRREILDAARSAPSSFNIQPYRFYWIESPEQKRIASELCMGQKPAETAQVLVVAVADIGSWDATVHGQLAWMRKEPAMQDKVAEHERRAKFAKWFFVQGWFNILGGVKWVLLTVLHLWKKIGMAPVTRQGLFKWATKNTALACQNLMIAAEALDLNTCPMEGFDGRRLSQFLELSPRNHEIVMVIAIGKKSAAHIDYPQWRRPLESTVAVL